MPYWPNIKILKILSKKNGTNDGSFKRSRVQVKFSTPKHNYKNTSLALLALLANIPRTESGNQYSATHSF